MNPIPNLSFWLQTLGLLAVQTAVVVGLAAGVQIWLKSAAARRAAWQGALLGVALLAINAFTGADRTLAAWARLEPAARPIAVVRGNLSPTLDTASDNAEFPVVRSVRAAATEATAPSTAFWWPAWLWVAGALIVGGRALGSRLLLAALVSRAQTALLPGRRQGSESSGFAEKHSRSMSPERRTPVRRVGSELEQQVRAELEFGAPAPRPPGPVNDGGILLESPSTSDGPTGAVVDPELRVRVASLAERLGFRRPVRLIESAALVGPIAFGWWRPTIGLPQGFFARHSQAEQDTMLAHELAHLAARDPLWLALADALSAALWWHPAVWWLRRQFRVASETAADDASLLVQDGPVILADCLVNLAAQLQTRRATGWLGIAEFRSGLGRRVERLLRLRPEEAKALGQKARWVAPALVAFVLLGLAAAAWAFPNSRSEGPTLFALVQEAMGPEPLQESDLRRRRIVQLPGTTVHNSLTGLSVSAPTEERAVELALPSDGDAGPDWPNPGVVPPAEREPRATKNRPVEMFTRSFHLTSSWSLDGSEAVIDPSVPASVARPANASNSLRGYLAAAGWTPGPGETVFLSGWGKRLFVRATLTNLTLIEAALAEHMAKPDRRLNEPGTVSTNRTLGQGRQQNAPLPDSTPESASDSTTVQSNVLAARLVQDARLCFEMGKLDEAEAKLRRAAQLDPDNKAALYYLELVEARRSTGGVRSSLLAIFEAPSQTNEHMAQEWLAPTQKPVPARAQSTTNSAAGGQLFTRTYKVDFHALVENMTNATGQGKTNALSTHEALDWYFCAAGWNRATNETFFLNEGSGVLFVRARQASFDVIDSVLQVLTATTPQVLVQVKFVEVSQDDEKALGFDWYLGQVTGTPTNSPIPGVTSGIRGAAPGAFPGNGQTGGASPLELRGDELDWVGRGATNARNIWVSMLLAGQLRGILTEAQSRVVMKALEQRPGTDVLSAPSVTTLSGRQAQVRVQEMKTVVTGTDLVAGTNAVTTAVIPCGPMLDILPTVLADGVTIQVNVKASLTGFLGYDPATPVRASGPQPRSQPRFRLREMKTIANVWDGQTLILGGAMVEPPGSFTNAATTGKVARKQLFVFVTPTIVDPAGNRVHTHEEMPFSTNAVPPQPKQGK
jgi:type II secretory pathway component GspD/PulD (secretin)/Zn-dependent protease with chaperone function